MFSMSKLRMIGKPFLVHRMESNWKYKQKTKKKNKLKVNFLVNISSHEVDLNEISYQTPCDCCTFLGVTEPSWWTRPTKSGSPIWIWTNKNSMWFTVSCFNFVILSADLPEGTAFDGTLFPSMWIQRGLHPHKTS